MGGISPLRRCPLRSKGSQTHTRLPSLGHQCEEEEPLHLAIKTSRDCVQDKQLLETEVLLLEGPCTDSLCNTSTGAAAWKTSGTREKLKRLTLGYGLEGQLPRGGSTGKRRCSFELSHATSPTQVGAKSVHSINLTNTVWPTLVFPWDPAPPNLLAQPEPLPAATLHKHLASAHAAAFPPNPQTSQELWLP